MKSISRALAKGTIATVAAGAMAVSTATPAFAEHRDHRDRGGISTGEVIAGAVILGGLAAIIASSDNDRDRHRYHDRRYRDRDYRYNDRRYDNRGYRHGYGYNGHRGDNARQAVEQCVRAAERRAERWTGRNAEVYEIRDIDRERGGFEVKGRIAVEDGYWRGHRNDYRRSHRNNGWDEGRFTCDVRHGRVVDIDFRGIRNL